MSGTVTKLCPADAEELLGMVEELGRRVDYLTRVAEQHEGKLVRNATALDEHAEALDAHEDRLDRHGERLVAVEDALPARALSLADREGRHRVFHALPAGGAQ